MTSPPECCPHCGAEKEPPERALTDTETWYECSTTQKPDGRWSISFECQRRELTALRSRVEALEGALISLKEPWCKGGDESLPEDAAIDAVYPIGNPNADTSCFKRYENALRMVGKRRSKYALVDLVNWLLTRAEQAEKALAGKGGGA